MSKKKLITILIIFLVILLVIIRLIVNISKEKNSIKDFGTIRELVEYDGHKYISQKKSEEEGFERDIYIQFSNEPITSDGISNQGLYEILIKHISEKVSGHNFKIIDEEKNIIIRIKYEDNKVSTYTINNDSKYWKNLLTDYETKRVSQERTTNFTINSSILANLINNNWEYDKLNIGTKDSECDNYNIYLDEGYKIRTINSKIYNIVFTKNYNQKIINQIGVGTSFNQIQSTLGEITYRSDTGDIIGYKGIEMYVFFSEDEISIYPVSKYSESDSNKFGSIVTELNKTGDTNTFLNKLTDIYPDYATYYKEESYVNIIYPQRGFEVIIGADQNNGITLYSNFQGKVTDTVTISDIINNSKAPTNVYLDLEKNLLMRAEEARVEGDYIKRNPYVGMAKLETDKYSVLENENKYSFYSVDKTQIDSELKVENISSIINYGQTMFIYGVKNDGIYLYNAENRNTRKLHSGQGNFEITKIENNVIYYDNTTLQL